MASVSDASPSRNTRAATKADATQYALWDFANKLRHSKKNTMTRPPTNPTKKEANKFIDRVALLEVLQTPTPCIFKPASHLAAMIVRFDSKEKKFLVQPYNQSGEKDGKAQLESADDLWLFPEKESKVKVQLDKGEVKIQTYDLLSSRVYVEKVSEKESPVQKKRVRRKLLSRKARAANASGKPPLANASKKSPKKSPKKRKAPARSKTNKKVKQNPAAATKKKALDKPTTSSVSTDEDASAGSNKYTLYSVLRSFANPRSTYSHMRAHMLVVIYDTHIFVSYIGVIYDNHT